MDWKLELLVLPVADVDRAKDFYVGRAGWVLIVDHQPNESFRVVQVCPPGSACAIAFGIGLGDMEPGSLRGLHLVVPDIEAAHTELVERGIGAGQPYTIDQTGTRRDGVDPTHQDYASFMEFADADGNLWLVQEVGHTNDG
jgi:catechol 2,3-dioxygenase-like lactoylglutathione lyase family enzyme